MGKVYDGIDDELAAWLASQPLFFVATAPLSTDGHVNVSPRGHDTFSVLGSHRVGWVDLTGSGIETIAHLRENGRVCLMWNAFSGKPRVVRLHGSGRVVRPGTEEFDDLVRRHPDNPSTRAGVVVDVHRVSDSCGFGVPVMRHESDRQILSQTAVKKGPEGLRAYRKQKNALSVDGLPGL